MRNGNSIPGNVNDPLCPDAPNEHVSNRGFVFAVWGLMGLRWGLNGLWGLWIF